MRRRAGRGPRHHGSQGGGRERQKTDSLPAHPGQCRRHLHQYHPGRGRCGRPRLPGGDGQVRRRRPGIHFRIRFRTRHRRQHPRVVRRGHTRPNPESAGAAPGPDRRRPGGTDPRPAPPCRGRHGPAPRAPAGHPRTAGDQEPHDRAPAARGTVHRLRRLRFGPTGPAVLRRRVHPPGHVRAHARQHRPAPGSRGVPAAGRPQGPGGQRRQERIPGQHEPRDPHPLERHTRHAAAHEHHEAGRRTVRVRTHGHPGGPAHDASSVRHPRPLQGRGRQADPAGGPLFPERGQALGPGHLQAGQLPQGRAHQLRTRPAPARAPRGRRDAPAADSPEPRRQFPQVHRTRLRARRGVAPGFRRRQTG